MDGKATVSRSATAKNNDAAQSTLLRKDSAEFQGDAKVSGSKAKSKQATLDRYWSKKLLDCKTVETVCNPTTDTVAETISETLEYGSDLDQKVDDSLKQASDDGFASETMPETSKDVSTPDTDAIIETLEYDSAASENGSADNPSTVASDSSAEHLQLGTTFDEMAAACEACRDLPPLCLSASHTVLFILDTADKHCTSIPKPNPSDVVYEEARWDNGHVRLPYSPQNKLLVNKVVVSRWGKITSSLTAADWNSSYDIEHAILSYNKYKWDFTELHRYFSGLTEEEHDLFFSQTLPKIVQLALSLPSVCTQPIPLLRKQKAARITMSQQQAACLLANAFFCTFPSRNTNSGSDDDIPHLPSINFNTLYRRTSALSRHSRHAKLDCLLHYFRRVTTDMPRGAVTFERQVR